MTATTAFRGAAACALTVTVAVAVAQTAATPGASAPAAPATTTPAPPPPSPLAPAAPAPLAGGETGIAAVYSDKLHGRKTASGERYDRNRLTAAHRTLAFGTQVKVTNPKTKKSVVVRINDRGPTQAGRILDLSPAAARALGIRPTGMAEVTTEVVAPPRKSGKG